jgi:hypothetical protein
MFLLLCWLWVSIFMLLELRLVYIDCTSVYVHRMLCEFLVIIYFISCCTEVYYIPCAVGLDVASSLVRLLVRFSCVPVNADCGLLPLMYRMCSWYLCFKSVLVCPTYVCSHVLQVSAYIPLWL